MSKKFQKLALQYAYLQLEKEEVDETCITVEKEMREYLEKHHPEHYETFYGPPPSPAPPPSPEEMPEEGQQEINEEEQQGEKTEDKEGTLSGSYFVQFKISVDESFFTMILTINSLKLKS